MTLEQLRIFLAVAEREHVTRAAEALNLTQSATSAAIAALEARHGTRLFERIGRGIRLTAAARHPTGAVHQRDAFGFEPRRIVLALSNPYAGHCYKVAVGFLPAP